MEQLERRSLLSLMPPSVGGDPAVRPADYRVSVFASGLNYPTGIVPQADGSMLVAVNKPPQGGTNFYQTIGQVVRLVDTNGDGVADGQPTILADNLPGSISAIQQAGPYVISTSNGGPISFLRRGASIGDPLSPSGTIQFGFPDGWWHMTYSLAVRPTPGQAGDFDVFFNVGSQYNGVKKDSLGNILFDSNGVAIPDPTTEKVPVSGLITSTLDGDAIYMLTLHDGGGTPELSNLKKVATGLRNAASMAIDPTSGDLIFVDNGIDGLEGGNEAYSTDTLHRIASAGIGSTTPDYGFPYSYTLSNDLPVGSERVVNPGGRVPPLVSFQPLPDPSLPATGSESEGAAGLAIAPPLFPAGLNRGVFVGFHGKFNSGGVKNEENPLIFADTTSGKYFNFIGNKEPNIGHFDGAASTSDSLFLSDVASTGQVFGSPGTGVIYQILAVNHEPVITSISPQSIGEGSTLTLAVQATDQDSAQTLRYALGSGFPAGAAIDPATGVFTWTPADGPSSALITVLVSDNGRSPLQAEASFYVTVNNIAPAVTLSPVPPRVPVGLFQGTGAFVDPGADTWTGSVSFGDRTRTVPLVLRPDKSFGFSHRYGRRGTYTVTIKVRDSDGATSTRTFKIVVGPVKKAGPKSASGSGKGLPSP